MNNYSEISLQLSNSSLVGYSQKILEDLENEIFFAIASSKDQVYRSKCEIFVKNKLLKINIISNKTNLGNASRKILTKEINTITSKSLTVDSPSEDLIKKLENSLIITTSNVFAEIGAIRLGRLYEKLPNSIFVIHDYDNHHWINNNIQAAIFADVYVPAHQDEHLLASRLNPNILGGIPCGSNQWSADFISSYGVNNLLNKRSPMPLGKYYFYEKFTHRNKLITTLSKDYPGIDFVKADFHSFSEEEKWREWSSHALHLIAPVLNDLPIRFFDALITGGIPIIPSGLKPFVESLQIPEEFYGIYRPLDLMNLEPLLASLRERFEKLGDAGIIKRHAFAFEHFHIDKIIEKLIVNTLRLYTNE